jgi:riboflavin synthase
MFTGLIEDVGHVVTLESTVLRVMTSFSDAKAGESISVNGICLTVTKLEKNRNGLILDFDFSPETKLRTNIGDLKKGSFVNLERALKVGDRLGGHIMTGHIEGKGKLLQKKQEDNSWLFVFSLDEDLRKYIIPKGSVGVDGISLTVVESRRTLFSVSIIPHTLENTNLHHRKSGETVNIEPDILAKYVESMLNPGSMNRMTEEFLREHGFAS